MENNQENNCFAFKDGKCEILIWNALLKREKRVCGSLECPFYKPQHLRDGVRIEKDGTVRFYEKGEYEDLTGIHYLSLDEMKRYESEYNHAEDTIFNDIEVDDENFKIRWQKERLEAERQEEALERAKKFAPQPVPDNVKLTISKDSLKSVLWDIAKKYHLNVKQADAKKTIYEAIMNS